MADEVNPRLQEALQSRIQPKLESLEWSTGSDDLALSEYIVLMVANGKTQDEIASDLFNDFKDLGATQVAATEFSRWLFEQIAELNSQMNGGSQQPQGEQLGEQQAAPGQDAQMGDASDASQQNIPTGPKAMRNGNPKSRNGRVLGQMNKAMDRSNDAALHRVRGTAGTGRINAHANREPPKGPRNQMNRNTQLNQMMNGPMGRGQMPMSPMGPMGQMGHLNPMNMTNMSPEQQMQMLSYWEEGARMMQQMLMQGGGVGGPVMNPAFQHGNQQGKSLFDRVQGKPRQNSNFNGRAQHQKPGGFKNQAQDTTMGGTKDENATDGDDSTAMDVEGSYAQKDPSQVVCKFNLHCTKPDCAFAHQSPAAPDGTPIDMNDVCTYGAACKNHKCVGRHPSPAKRAAFQAEQDCRYGPNCTNPHCQFKHPTMPPCRNGADCKVPNCKFAHSKIICKYNPCRNANCIYKHTEEQKRGAFSDKVWTPGEDGKGHVSERKFTEDGIEEELIIPGRPEGEPAAEVAT